MNRKKLLTWLRDPTSLSVRVLSSVLLLIVVTGLLLGFTGVHIIESFAQERFGERMSFLARHLALNAELGLLIDAKNMLEPLARNVLVEKGVVRVVIEDQQGNQVINVFRPGVSEVGRVSQFVTTSTVNEENMIFGSSNPETVLPRRSIIGKVILYYSDEELKALITSLKTRFAGIAVGVCLLGFFLMLFIVRSILAPLRNLVEATRRVANGELNIEVGGGNLKETTHLAQSFNAMLNSIRESRNALKESYEELARQKNMAEVGKFSMILTHEFKNPLGIIKGSLAILRKSEVSDDTRMLMIQYIEEEIQQIDHLIEEFLMFSRPKKPDLKPCDCESAMARIVERFRIGIGSRGPAIRFTASGEAIYCLIDEALFCQALENILKNAVEVSDPEGTVQLRSYAEEKWWNLIVQDEGPGIPPEARGLVFEPFYTTKAKGTGLGLAIAANVIQAHHGKIEVMDNSAQGAVFRIRLPLISQSQIGEENEHGTHTGC